MIPPKVAITPEVMLEWASQAAELLAAGWKETDVRDHLTQSGCTPKALQSVMNSAKKAMRSSERKAGLGLIFFGVLLVLVAVSIVAVQLLLFPGSKWITVPSGLGLVGAIAIVRGLLKGVFG